MLRTVVLVVVFSSWCLPVAYAQDGTTDAPIVGTADGGGIWSSNQQQYYYRPDGRGAHAFYCPINVIVEGGFGALYSKKLHEFDFVDGAEKLGYTFVHPIELVREYGWKKFFWYEFIPHPGEGTNWTPNWNWHLIGGGFRTRMLKEYFIHHGYEHPTLYAWMTAYSYHLINELLQAQKFEKGSTDAMADLFFFDWIGKVLFEIDLVNRVATHYFHLTDWTYQSQWNPLTNSLINNGQLYWSRFHIYGPLSLSILTGEQLNSLNMTLGFGRHQGSVGFGLKASGVVINDSGDPVADSMRYNIGLTYSRDDNPVVVATYELYTLSWHDDRWEHVPLQDAKANKEGRLMVNLYPGWFDIKGFEPGFSLMWEGDMVFVGITAGQWPMGFALSNQAQLN